MEPFGRYCIMIIPGVTASSSRLGGTDTTGDNKQAFLLVGDSIAKGTSISGKGPAPASGTVYEYDGTSVVEVGSNDLSIANTGSQYPQLGTTYYNSTGKKCVFVDCGTGGAFISPGDASLNWTPSGTLYGPMKTKANNGLAALGITKYRGIILIVGINDAGFGTTLSTIQSDLTALISRLSADFPNTRIYIVNLGRTSSAISNTRIDTIRGYYTTIIASNTQYKQAFDLRDYANNNPEYFSPDNIHLNQTGCNALGVVLANYIIAN